MADALPKPFTHTKAELKEFQAVDEIKAKIPYYLAGYDNKKRPVIVSKMGHYDIKGILDNVPNGKEQFKTFQQQLVYRMLGDAGWVDASNGVFFINDMKDFDNKQLTSPKVVKYMIRGTNLVEALIDFDKSTTIVVNMTPGAEKLLALIKPFAKKITSQAEYFGTDSAKYIERILKDVPKDQLPEEYGGNPGWKAVKGN